jgi:uncharacterized protein (TIGR03083 family)
VDNSTVSTRRLTQLAELQSAFASSIPVIDAATPVPWCGSWTVRDLVEHLAEVHSWAAAMARGDDARRLPPTDDLLDRYRGSAAELVDTLARLDPDAPARTLAGAGTVSFWHRRQLHETLIHLWDLRTAGGRSLVADPLLWVDTVDEAVTVLHPRQVRLGRAPAAVYGSGWSRPMSGTRGPCRRPRRRRDGLR